MQSESPIDVAPDGALSPLAAWFDRHPRWTQRWLSQVTSIDSATISRYCGRSGHGEPLYPELLNAAAIEHATRAAVQEEANNEKLKGDDRKRAEADFVTIYQWLPFKRRVALGKTEERASRRRP